MNEQRHRIRRQVLELQVPDEAAARRLQPQLGRIQRQRLAPLVDRCLTESSRPQRLHRIESLVIDLGTVDPENLERDLVEKLERRLRQALAERLRAEESEAAGRGVDPGTASRLELLESFVRTGRVPWWADSSRPQLLDENLARLARDAPRALAVWLRERLRNALRQGPPVAAASPALQRIVLHTSDERLAELFGLLCASPSAAAARCSEVAAALRARPELPRTPRPLRGARWKSAVWQAVLCTACREEDRSAEAVEFWRTAFAEVAGRLRVPLASLVTALARSFAAPQERAPGALAEVIEGLAREVAGGPTATSPPPRVARANDTDGGAYQQPAPSTASDVGRQEVRPRLPGQKQGQGVPVATGGGIPGNHHRLDQPPPALPLPPLHEAPPRVARADGADGAAYQQDVPSTASDVGRQEVCPCLPEQEPEQGVPDAAGGGIPDHHHRLDEPPQGLPWPPLDHEQRPEGWRARDTFSDSDVEYVENSGLVLLWPFLVSFFERLEFLVDRRFRDQPARHRAVGLLQYVAAEDPAPPEYQVTLGKVLCGMEVREVFDFGPPVTEQEAEECRDLLRAAISHAPILNEMSIRGFRGTFLLRKGVLSARDGAWLLRVERETYDVVLDRFPWSASWVKLPFMEAPLRVEW